MNSRLFQCRVMHERTSPVSHRFVYRLFLLAIDLDELPQLQRRLRLFSVNRRNVYSWHERDYLPLDEPRHPDGALLANAHLSLKDRVIQLLRHHGLEPGTAPRVELITLPRIFGYAFNPVSFFFCTTKDGRPVGTIAAVTNTFREQKPFVLPPVAATARGDFQVKEFYVSPFSAPDLAFHFRLPPPQQRLRLRIDVYRGTQRTLASALTGRAQPLTDAALLGFTMLYPLLTLKVITAIHWQAFRLFLKRVPWFPKAGQPEQQRHVYRPHSSLTAPTR